MINILKYLKLEQHIEVFNDEGIETVDDFNDYEDEDLIDIGLKKPHIKRLRRYFEENSSSKNKEVEIKQEWHQALYNNADIWNDELLNLNIPIISHEYKRVQALLSQGQYFGVLLQIKDFLEVLLKLPVLIILNEKFNTQCESNEIKAFILSSLEKPLSLGHWHELATLIKKNDLIEDENFKKLINNIVKLYNRNNIIKWRNDEIGHGALSLDDDKEFQDDISNKLNLIKKFLDDNIDILKEIKIDKKNSTISYRNDKFSSYPFFHINDDKIYFFDSYLSRKQKTHQLNYCYGKKVVSTIDDFSSFITQNEANKRDDKLSNSNITDVRLAEDENKLDNLESDNDFIKPEYLINWLKDTMDSDKKGKLLLQMQRGTGKSLFCKALDQLSLNKIRLDNDMLIRAYYINDMYRNSLSNFSSEISHFILNKDIQSNTLVDKFKGNLPTLTNDSTKEDFAYMLSWYKKHYNVEKLLLIIDAVDEIPQGKEKSIFDILPDNEQLEDGIFILITSRINDEIIEYTQNNIEVLDYISDKSVSKESDENLSILKSYITKYKLAKNDTQIEQLISKSDYRILYLNMLKEIILSSNIDIDNIPEQEAIIDYYLKNIKNKYGEKYYSNIFKILIILASQLEELTIKEISLLNNDAMLNLKLIANMFDLRGFIKKTRDTNGNKFSLSHISLVKYLNDKYQNEIINYLYEIYSNISSFNPEDEADIYKMAYLQRYEAIYGIDLSKDLDNSIVLSFLKNILSNDFTRKVKIGILLIELLQNEKDINNMIDSLKQIDIKVLEATIIEKIQDDNFVNFIVNNIDEIVKNYDETQYNVIKVLYMNFYKYNDRDIAFKLQKIVVDKHQRFEDILNYISMCKGNSKWEEAQNTINRYIDDNNFNDLQLAQFYYIIGRMYVDMIDKFQESKTYLEKSIAIYDNNNEHIKLNIVKNTLSMYYFSNGEYDKAIEILTPIYNEVIEDNGIIYEQNAIEAICNNIYGYNLVKNIEIKNNMQFLNKEIELYYLNTKAIFLVQNNQIENAINSLNQALEIATVFNKNYAKSAILYNLTILSNDGNILKEAQQIINNNGYSMGQYIIENKDSKEHILNTFTIDSKHYWICVKNIDLLV